jgi:hypothetical protein
LLLFLAFVFPLGIYCLILAWLNQRDRPVLVSGRWDFAGVLFAASGLLLFVAPRVLKSLYERWHEYLLLGHAGESGEASGLSYYLWLGAWCVYAAAVILGSVWMLNRRRQMTAVYNIDPAVLEVALARVLERLGVHWKRMGCHFFLNPESSDDSMLVLEPFSILSHATLRWQAVDEPTRQAIERELDQVLAGMPTTANPVGGWFLSAGTAILLVTLAGVAFAVLRTLRVIRWW